jgi:hypothetical protein
MGYRNEKNTRKRILVSCMIKFLCPTLNNLQTFNEGTVTHTVSRPVHTSASMAYVTAAVVHPPISGSAVGKDGMQTVSVTKPDAKIKWCEFRGTWRPSNWAANLCQSISFQTFGPNRTTKLRRRYILWA